MQVGIRVFEAAVEMIRIERWFLGIDRRLRQPARRLGEGATEQPIDPGTQPDEQRVEAKAIFDHRVEPNLLDPRRIVRNQLIAA